VRSGMASREQAELRVWRFRLRDLAGIDLNDVVALPAPAHPPPLVAPVAGDGKRGVIVLVIVGQLADKVRRGRLDRVRQCAQGRKPRGGGLGGSTAAVQSGPCLRVGPSGRAIRGRTVTNADANVGSSRFSPGPLPRRRTDATESDCSMAAFFCRQERTQVTVSSLR
jgi:hypothetical protein